MPDHNSTSGGVTVLPIGDVVRALNETAITIDGIVARRQERTATHEKSLLADLYDDLAVLDTAITTLNNAAVSLLKGWTTKRILRDPEHLAVLGDATYAYLYQYTIFPHLENSRAQAAAAIADPRYKPYGLVREALEQLSWRVDGYRNRLLDGQASGYEVRELPKLYWEAHGQEWTLPEPVIDAMVQRAQAALIGLSYEESGQIHHWIGRAQGHLQAAMP